MASKPSTENPAEGVYQYDNPYFTHNTNHDRLVLVSDRQTAGAGFCFNLFVWLSMSKKLGFIDGIILIFLSTINGMILKPFVDHHDYRSLCFLV